MSPTLGKRRKTFNKAQRKLLMKRFYSWTYKHLGDEEILQFAVSFNISEQTIENWFRSTCEKKRIKESVVFVKSCVN